MSIKRNKAEAISREYKIFASFATILMSIAYCVFCFISYQSHKETYQQKYLSLGFSVANNYEFFLDNIFRQAEFIGHKIENSDRYNRATTIQFLLKQHFSIGVDLDTSRLSNWLPFNWEDYDITSDNYQDTQLPWEVNFGLLHSTSTEVKDSYLPISFGVSKKSGQFIGSLISQIRIKDLTSYIRRGIDAKVYILILDRENNVISQSPENRILTDYFKKYSFVKSSGILTKIITNGIKYVAYKRLNSYPFTVVIGESEQNIFKPLLDNLIKYLVLFIVVLILFLAILLLFYRSILIPIISLSKFADKIIHFKGSINYIPKKTHFFEIQNLSEALVKIEFYKKKIYSSNHKLKQKTQELELIKNNLEQELDKLANAYAIRDKFNKEAPNKIVESTTEFIKNIFLMLYPEIYSRKLKVNILPAEDIHLQITYNQFAEIVMGLLSRSFIFSTKNSPIEIRADSAKLENIDYLLLIIADQGLGDEEWRSEQLKNIDMERITDLVTKNKGFISVFNKEIGVEYKLLLPQKKSLEETKNQQGKAELVYLFSKKP